MTTKHSEEKEKFNTFSFFVNWKTLVLFLLVFFVYSLIGVLILWIISLFLEGASVPIFVQGIVAFFCALLALVNTTVLKTMGGFVSVWTDLFNSMLESDSEDK